MAHRQAPELAQRPLCSYLLLKWLLVLSAIAVVGAHATYGFWVVRGSSHPEALPFVLRNIKWLDERIALRGNAGLLLTGLGMGFMARALFATPWLISGMRRLLLLLLLHLFVYRPTVIRMIRLLDSEESTGLLTRSPLTAR